ncbi:hypothetical protein [Kitasatospora sp. NBC_01300]|uniref:hypothetical protein n=1 Tax=Kitasatospora sp. NBC_01300 TaxID=2903574 RepID=UPI002F916045|nr:hypothetical protein OG556_40500 [Kitasatospora sp. NBC_01300]
MTSTDVRTVPCPTCGTRAGQRCVTLRDKPCPALHRARTHRYLEVRFGLRPQTTTTWQALLSATEARRRGALLRTRFRDLDNRLWQPTADSLLDTIAVDSAAYEEAVIAEACGRTGPDATDFLFSPDWIDESLDALLRAAHDLQIRAETDQIATGTSNRELIRCRDAVRRRLKEMRALADRTRKASLPSNHATAEATDPHQVATAWVGRFLKAERRHLVTEHALAAGMDAAQLDKGTFHERVARLVATGRMKAPVGPQVERLLSSPTDTLRETVLRDALQPGARTDALGHPLVLETWAEQLDFLSTVAAPAAYAAPTGRLSALPPMTSARMTTAAADELAGRRQTLARLIERTHECERLRLAVSDTVTALDRTAPGREALGGAIRAADEELRRRHPELYAIARAHLYAYQDPSGRLAESWPDHHAAVRSTVLLALERFSQAPTALLV